MSKTIEVKYGKQNVSKTLDQLLTEKDKEVVAIGISKKFTNLYSHEWRASWQLQRIKKGIIGKSIYNTDPETAEYITKQKVPTLSYKFLPSYYNGNHRMTIFVCGDMSVIFYYESRPMRTIIIHDREIANSYKQQFKELWGQAKNTIGEDYFNIFERSDIVKNYRKMRNISETIFSESAKIILRDLKSSPSIVEGGCGDGRLTTPLLEQLDKSGVNYSYKGFDVSQPMLDKIQKYRITQSSKVKIFKNSAYNLSVFKNEKVDAYILSYVLHIAKYKQVLHEDWSVFKKVPTYVIFRDDTFFRLINGNKTKIKGILADFWAEYWNTRKGFNLSAPKSITDTSPFDKPISYIKKHGKKVTKLGVSKWEFTETYNQFLKYILIGGYTALGNIPEDWRKLLYYHMKEWLKNNKINSNISNNFVGEQTTIKIN